MTALIEIKITEIKNNKRLTPSVILSIVLFGKVVLS